MTNFKININLQSLHISGNQAITGDINVQIEDRYFPNKGWNDFTVIILEWWTNNFVEFIRHNTDFCDFNFMDGHYKFKFIKESNKLEVLFFNSNDAIIDSCFISQEQFVDTLLTTGENVIKKCKSVNWNTPEINNLIKSVKTLDELLKINQ